MKVDYAHHIRAKVRLILVILSILLIFVYLGCNKVQNDPLQEKYFKLWEIPLEVSNTLGTSLVELTPFGFLVLHDESMFLIEPNTGEIKWIVEEVTPLIADIFFDPLILFEENTAVVPLRIQNDRIPSLTKIELESGEIVWSQSIARNSPPIHISRLTKEDGNIVVAGNFGGGDDHHSDKPVFGSYGEGVALHDFETGKLIDAFSVDFGSILARDETFYYSKSEGDYYKIGARDLGEGLTDKDKTRWERILKKESESMMEIAAAVTESGAILWKRKGELLPRIYMDHDLYNLPRLFPNFAFIEEGKTNIKKRLLIIEELKKKEESEETPKTEKELVSLVNAEDGEAVSRYEVINGDGFIFNETAFLFSNKKRIKVLNALDGSNLWQRQIDERTLLSVEFKNKVLKNICYLPLLKKDNTFELLDPKTGNSEYSFFGITNVIKEDEVLYLVGEKNLKKISPDLKWEKDIKDIDGESFNLYLEEDDITVFGTGETVLVIDNGSGERLLSYQHDEGVKPRFLHDKNLILEKKDKLIYLVVD